MLCSRKERLEMRGSFNFKQTNEPWNKFNLNQAWTIGLMTLIISNKNFNNFSEWENYYFESGKERQNLLSHLDKDKALKLRDLTANYTNPYRYKEHLSIEEVRINENYGRTIDEIRYLSDKFHGYLSQSLPKLNISRAVCFNYVYIRIIDEIYIGFEREVNTIKRLRKLFKDYSFVKTDFETDRKFAIDVEVYYKNILVCGIQIKSVAYKINNKNILKETKSFNHTKNEKYEKINNVPVVYVYSSTEGFIQNTEIFEFLRTYKKDAK